VRQGYIKAPGLSCYKKPNSNTADKIHNRNSPFRCPEGTDEDSGIFGGGGGDYPTDARNNAFMIQNDTECAKEGFAIASWYQLNCRNTSDTNAWCASPTGTPSKQGNRITPFMGFQSGSQNNIAMVKDPAWQRRFGMVK
jgi:hypothetical protein